MIAARTLGLSPAPGRLRPPTTSIRIEVCPSRSTSPSNSSTSSTRSPLSQMPFAEPMSLTRISPLILLISAWRPDIEVSFTAMSHWSERPIVTVIARMG